MRRISLACGCLLAAAAACAAPFAYVADTRPRISVIDLATNTVVTRMTGELTPGGIAASRADSRLYVTDLVTGTLRVIDTATNSTIATLDVCPIPTVPVLNAAGTRLVVPCLGLALFAIVIDTATFQQTPVPVPAPTGSAWDGNGRLYVNGLGNVYVFDAAQQQATFFRAPPGNFGIAVNAAGTRVYVASNRNASSGTGENLLTVYDAAAGFGEIKRVALPSNSGWIALDPSGTRLYVPLIGSDALAVFDAGGNPLATVQLPAGSQPKSVAVHPDGSRVSVNLFGTAQLAVLQAPAYSTVATVDLGAPGVADGNFIGIGSAAAAANTPGFHTGIWWNPQQSGWGLSVTRRGLNVFLAWFTYDNGGRPAWHVATCQMVTPACTGTLLQVRGVFFDFAGPYDATFAETAQSGIFELAFTDSNHGRLEYSVGDVNTAVDIQRQVIAAQGPIPAVNYTDLWWNPAQSGWGIHITHQRNQMFLAWFLYDGVLKPAWLVMSCAVNAAGNACSGTLYRTTGPNFDSVFDPVFVRALPAGTMTVTFTGLNDARLDYTVDGVTGSKIITRQVF